MVVLACVLVANPFSGAGFMDDWSYSHLALRLAQTGHVHYDGYGSPTMLFQAIWAEGWIRIFGFSFNLMRLITLPFSLGFVLLIYLAGCRIGLRRDLALFGALTVGTTPLFLPLAASFMTDVYGCFFCMLCIYAALASVGTVNRRAASGWLWTLAVSGILGGSDRQTVWVAPLALIPYLFWTRRMDRRFSAHCLAAYLLCIAALVFINTHFKPPYAVFALHGQQVWAIVQHNFPSALAVLSGLFFASLLIALPALLCFSPSWKELGNARLLVIGFGSLGAVVVMIVSLGQFGAAPFAVGTLSEFGVLLNGWDSLGFKPVVLRPTLRLALSVVVVFSGAAFCFVRHQRSIFDRHARAIFVIFAVAYVGLLVPGAILSITFDRYVLPLVPGLVLFLLSLFNDARRRIPFVAWICLFVFASYSVTITHDYASASRARVQAAEILQRQGVPRSHISAGFEYDGWTHLELVGSMISTTYRDGFDWNRTDRFWFWHYTTAIHPEYVVSSSRTPGGHALAAVQFATWLPPFRRFAVVQRQEYLPRSPVCNTLQTCSVP